jgi:putative DNA primase/helicase
MNASNGSKASFTFGRGRRKEEDMSTSKDSKGPNDGSAKQKRDAAAEIVLHVVRPEQQRGNLELFHNLNGACFATARVRDHHETMELNGPEFKDLLCRAIWKATGENPSDAVFNKILRQLRAEAKWESPEIAVFHRIAQMDGGIYLDLSNEMWQVVEVGPSGWWIAEDPPVRFVRSSVSRALPVPERGGDLNDIFNLVNITKRADQVLFLSWLLATFQTRAAYPILMLVGSQGSAKSTTAKIATGLIDPAEPQTVSGYSSERDLLIDSQHSHVIGIDNVSAIDDKFSDALCRLATGSGMRRRKLYSDSTLFALAAKNPLILNGISQVAVRGDLLDRMIALKLDSIPESNRREEAKVIPTYSRGDDWNR